MAALGRGDNEAVWGVREIRTRLLSGRLLLYVVGLAGAIALEPLTPLGVAEWILTVLLVCVAAILGGALEMTVVASLGTVGILIGLFISPATYRTPFWMAAVNRLSGVAVMWAVVAIRRRQRAAEARLRILQGLLPICASCKRIRGGDDHWQALESYISQHSEASFTHSLCPECFAKYMRD